MDDPGTVMLDMPGDECYHSAPCSGLVEPLVDLGEPVHRGMALARIWPIERSGGAPETILAQGAGILAARHFPGLAQIGDTLAVVAVPRT